MDLTEGLYRKYSLKRVFYSAYLPVVEDRRLPALHTAPPLLREHRLYQADWLLRYYHFSARELLTEDEPNFDPYLDPKCTWPCATRSFSPWRSTRPAVPSCCGCRASAPRVRCALSSAPVQSLGMAELKRIGVVIKRAQYFITCKGKAAARGSRAEIAGALLDPKAFSVGMQQLSLDDFVPKALPDAAPAVQRLEARGMAADVAARTVRQEALQCLTKRM